MPKTDLSADVVAMEKVRRGHGITAKVFCERAQLAHSTWCAWKKGAKPRAANLKRAREALKSLISDAKRGNLP